MSIHFPLWKYDSKYSIFYSNTEILSYLFGYILSWRNSFLHAATLYQQFFTLSSLQTKFSKILQISAYFN